MATDLTHAATVRELPAVERERTLSLPASVRSLIGALGEVTVDGRTTKYLPAAMSLTSQERSDLENRARAIAALLNGAGQSGARLAHLAKFVAAFRNSGGSELDREAQGEAFEDALDDVPAWVVVETIRRWNRAEIGVIDGQKINLNFQPTPPIFRLACLNVLKPYADDLQRLRELLEAKPLSAVLDRKPDPNVVQGFADLSKSLGAVVEDARPVNEKVAEIAKAARERNAAPAQPEGAAHD